MVFFVKRGARKCLEFEKKIWSREILQIPAAMTLLQERIKIDPSMEVKDVIKILINLYKESNMTNFSIIFMIWMMMMSGIYHTSTISCHGNMDIFGTYYVLSVRKNSKIWGSYELYGSVFLWCLQTKCDRKRQILLVGSKKYYYKKLGEGDSLDKKPTMAGNCWINYLKWQNCK